jgi:hypothetical protein
MQIWTTNGGEVNIKPTIQRRHSSKRPDNAALKEEDFGSMGLAYLLLMKSATSE